MTDRGLRNCNPGNINHNPAKIWDGELPFDASIEPRFCRFSSPEFGIRAIAKILLSYQRRGLDNLHLIASTWAPPSENDTAAYIKDLCQRVGVVEYQVIDVSHPDICTAVVGGIIHHENGADLYDSATIGRGVSLALGV